MVYIVTDRNNADRVNPIVDTFYTRSDAEQFANNEDNAGEGYEVEEWETADDAIDATDTVEEWLSNNPERLSYAYDNTTAVIEWKREAVTRLVKSQEDRNEVLENWATEAEAANAVEFSSNDDGDYVLVKADTADEAHELAKAALNNEGMADMLVNVGASYQVDANDEFRGDVGKWRMYYITQEQAEQL